MDQNRKIKTWLYNINEHKYFFSFLLTAAAAVDYITLYFFSFILGSDV